MKNVVEKNTKIFGVVWIFLGLILVNIGSRFGGKIFLPCCFICEYVFFMYVNRNFHRNLNKVRIAYKKNFETECAEEYYQEVLKHKIFYGKNVVVCQYLQLLLDTCQFDKFIEVYKDNRGLMSNFNSWKELDVLIFKVSELLKNRGEYRHILFRYKFSRYFKSKGKLNEINEQKRFRDRTIEILRVYEAGKYEKAIELIEQMKATLSWDQTYFFALKQRCFYHMSREYCVPDQERTKYLFVKQWDELVRGGEEYYEEKVCEIFQVLKKDRENAYMLSVIIYVVMILLLLFFVSEII